MPGEIRQGLGQILSDCQIQNHSLHLLNGVPVKKKGTLHKNIIMLILEFFFQRRKINEPSKGHNHNLIYSTLLP